jgi:hypothetical protein
VSGFAHARRMGPCAGDGGDGNLHFPTGYFSNHQNISRAAQVSVSLAFAASAFALDKGFEVADIERNPSAEGKINHLRIIVYMVRCAYAHGIADPKWEVYGKFRRQYSLELDGTSISIDFTRLHGEPFEFSHIGGHRNWFQVCETTLSALAPGNKTAADI